MSLERPNTYKLRTSKLPMMNVVGPVAILSAIAFTLALGSWYGVAGILVACPMAYLFLRTSVDVGVDGVLIRKTFSKRFIAYDEIESIRRKNGLVLELHSGEVVALHTDKRTAAEIAADVEEAHKRHARAEGDALGMVSPDHADAAAWLETLRGLLGGNSAYRRRVVTPEELATLVDGAASPLEARVGAAIALESAGQRGKHRLRIAAEGVADPDERNQLMRIADANDEDLESELEQVMARLS